MRRYNAVAFLLFLTLINLSGESLVDSINRFRRSEGLTELLTEKRLQETADDYCAVLAASGILSHVDENGNRVLDRYRLHGGSGSRAGEILGTSPDQDRLMEAWIASPDHRRVILNPFWTRIATSTTQKNGQLVAVVLFSVSTIENYSVFTDGEELRLSIIPLAGEELSLSQEPPFKRENLPLLLVINGGSDFLYLSDTFFKSTH